MDPAVPHRIIKIVQLAIAFECQFEPPLSPLKNNRLFILKLKTGISPDELPKSGHRWIDPPPFLALQLQGFFSQYKYLGISSMIRVLSAMHISKMVLKRKKSYKAKGERGG